MNVPMKAILAGILCLLLIGVAGSASAKVSAQEAEQLKTTLTPFGAERAGNADGTIPAWEGGYTTVPDGFVNGGKRGDLFPEDKVQFKITPQNMDQYADKLTEGTKALLKKYPDTFYINVYQTRRTAAAPQWAYDEVYKNATRSYVEGSDVKDVYGGPPFPIPKSGIEAIWNHQLRYRPASWHFHNDGLLGTAAGKLVHLNTSEAKQTMPIFIKGKTLEDYKKEWDGEFWLLRLKNTAPPVQADVAIVGRENLSGNKTVSYLYLSGQRRVRRLPISCCDVPSTPTGGMATYDETSVFTGAMAMALHDWKIVGKKEMYIPYNCNKYNDIPLREAVTPRHLHPEAVRYELHRVWVVEANLKKGKRHQHPQQVYYLDEDTWTAVLSDRYDANGDLWRCGYQLPMVLPDVPCVNGLPFGFYDLQANVLAAVDNYNDKDEQFRIQDPPYPNKDFTPTALQRESVR
ncbi:MAG: DUF1329 domain-containing protein [Desulfobacteraceae bacterium]